MTTLKFQRSTRFAVRKSTICGFQFLLLPRDSDKSRIHDSSVELSIFSPKLFHEALRPASKMDSECSFTIGKCRNKRAPAQRLRNASSMALSLGVTFCVLWHLFVFVEIFQERTAVCNRSEKVHAISIEVLV